LLITKIILYSKAGNFIDPVQIPEKSVSKFAASKPGKKAKIKVIIFPYMISFIVTPDIKISLKKAGLPK
jgi:hypothetical protein